MTAQEWFWAGVTGQLAGLAAGSVTSLELIEECLDRIARLDPALRAFRSLRGALARAEGAAADRERTAGSTLPLLGLPVAVKDNEPVTGLAARLGTPSPEPVAARDGDLVRRLRSAGAVVIGGTAMPELALWPFTESPATGRTVNPWAADRSPGGSSGGSAVAVAAGLVPAASGTDGGGSIRIPAACCHLVGLKPTHGLLTPGDAPDHWYGLSHAGFLTRTVADTVVLLAALTELPAELPDPGRLRIAMSAKPPVPGRGGACADQRAALYRVAGVLRDLGHQVVEVDPPYGELTSAFTPRYLRGAHDDLAALADPRSVEPRTRQVARLGAALPPRVVDWSRRQAASATLRLASFFVDHDLLLTPTLGQLPLRAGRFTSAGAVRTMLGVSAVVPYTVPWNVTGQPAAALPAGRTPTGVPRSVQLSGRRHGDATVLAVAAALEAQLGWAETHPDVDQVR
ncbi:MAG: amidase family protein [Mycobacteriales bacterium]